MGYKRSTRIRCKDPSLNWDHKTHETLVGSWEMMALNHHTWLFFIGGRGGHDIFFCWIVFLHRSEVFGGEACQAWKYDAGYAQPILHELMWQNAGKHIITYLFAMFKLPTDAGFRSSVVGGLLCLVVLSHQAGRSHYCTNLIRAHGQWRGGGSTLLGIFDRVMNEYIA